MNAGDLKRWALKADSSGDSACFRFPDLSSRFENPTSRLDATQSGLLNRLAFLLISLILLIGNLNWIEMARLKLKELNFKFRCFTSALTAI